MKLLLLPLLTAFVLPTAVNAEPASRYKVSCDDYLCTKKRAICIEISK